MDKRFYLCNIYDWWEMFWPPLATWGDLLGAANDTEASNGV